MSLWEDGWCLLRAYTQGRGKRMGTGFPVHFQCISFHLPLSLLFPYFLLFFSFCLVLHTLLTNSTMLFEVDWWHREWEVRGSFN